MDRGRRVKRLEDELDPQATILRWLHEAQQYPSLVVYARAHEAEAGAADPISVLLDRLADATYQAMRRRPTEELKQATGMVLREALRRYHLIVRLNLETEELLRLEGLRHVALAYRMRELSFRGQLAEHGEMAAQAADAQGLERARADWRTALAELITSLYAAQAAREALEARHLARHACLFDDLGDGCRDLIDRVERLHAIASSQGRIDDLDALRQAAAERVDAIADRLARMAWANTRVAMGDDVGAAELMRPLVIG